MKKKYRPTQKITTIDFEWLYDEPDAKWKSHRELNEQYCQICLCSAIGYVGCCTSDEFKELLSDCEEFLSETIVGFQDNFDGETMLTSKNKKYNQHCSEFYVNSRIPKVKKISKYIKKILIKLEQISEKHGNWYYKSDSVDYNSIYAKILENLEVKMKDSIYSRHQN